MNETAAIAQEGPSPDLLLAISEKLARRTRRPKGKLLEVLLVEDDEADAYLIEQALDELPSIGKVVRARDGVEALALIDTGEVRPDFALVDLQMPRMAGQQLLVEIFSRTQLDFPLIVLTSSTSALDIQRAHDGFAWKYIAKQTSIPAMRRSLNWVVRNLHNPV